MTEHLGQQQEPAPGTGHTNAAVSTKHTLAIQRNNQEWLSCFHWRTLEAGTPKPVLQCKPAAMAQLGSQTGSVLPAGFPPKSLYLPATSCSLPFGRGRGLFAMQVPVWLRASPHDDSTSHLVLVLCSQCSGDTGAVLGTEQLAGLGGLADRTRCWP